MTDERRPYASPGRVDRLWARIRELRRQIQETVGKADFVSRRTRQICEQRITNITSWLAKARKESDA